MKSITSDIKIYYNKLSRAAAQKLRRRRERGGLPSFDWRKSFEALPVVITARSYQRDFFASDLAAGLTEVKRRGEVRSHMCTSHDRLARCTPRTGSHEILVCTLVSFLALVTCPTCKNLLTYIHSLTPNTQHPTPLLLVFRASCASPWG